MRLLLAAALLAAPSLAQIPPMAVSARIPAGDGRWDYASVDPVKGRLYVARGEGVLMIDLATRKVIDKFVAADRGHAAFALPDGKTLVTTNGQTGDLRFFDAAGGGELGSAKTGQKPDAAIYLPARNAIAVANAKDGTVSLVDATTRKVTASIAVGGALEYMALAPNDLLYVNVEDRGELVEIDLKTRKVTRRTKLDGCEEPSGLAYLPGTGALLSACANGVAKVTRGSDGMALADLKIGPGPDAVLLDAARQRAYIPAGGDGTLAVIDYGSGTAAVVAMVPTQAGARTGAVDPRTGTVYLPTARFGPAPKGEDHGAAIPGSFEVLVVSAK